MRVRRVDAGRELAGRDTGRCRLPVRRHCRGGRDVLGDRVVDNPDVGGVVDGDAAALVGRDVVHDHVVGDVHHAGSGHQEPQAAAVIAGDVLLDDVGVDGLRARAERDALGRLVRQDLLGRELTGDDHAGALVVRLVEADAVVVDGAVRAEPVERDATAVFSRVVAADHVLRDVVVVRAVEEPDRAGQVRAAVAEDLVVGDEDVLVVVRLAGRVDRRGADADTAGVGAAIGLDHVVGDHRVARVRVQEHAAALGDGLSGQGRRQRAAALGIDGAREVEVLASLDGEAIDLGRVVRPGCGARAPDIVGRRVTGRMREHVDGLAIGDGLVAVPGEPCDAGVPVGRVGLRPEGRCGCLEREAPAVQVGAEHRLACEARVLAGDGAVGPRIGAAGADALELEALRDDHVLVVRARRVEPDAARSEIGRSARIDEHQPVAAEGVLGVVDAALHRVERIDAEARELTEATAPAAVDRQGGGGAADGDVVGDDPRPLGRVSAVRDGEPVAPQRPISQAGDGGGARGQSPRAAAAAVVDAADGVVSGALRQRRIERRDRNGVREVVEVREAAGVTSPEHEGEP